MSCYENTWKEVIDSKLEKNLSLFSKDLFKEKRLIVNNVNSFWNVFEYFKRKHEEIQTWGTWDEEVNEEILSTFGLSLKDFTIGLYYSIQHLSGIYLTECDYLLHVSEDCDISGLDDFFIVESIQEMEKSRRYIVAFPRWCPDIEDNFEQVLPKTGVFYYQYGFTDQVYLIKTEIFKRNIYRHKHPMSERYPSYGGECFEKRVDAYMRMERMYGIVHREYEYKHG